MAARKARKAKGAASAAPTPAAEKPAKAAKSAKKYPYKNSKGETILAQTRKGNATIERFTAGRGRLTFTRQVPGKK